MSGARTIEKWDGPNGEIRVRLCDGEQVLAERELDPDSLVDVVKWKCAETEIYLHGCALACLPHVVEPGDTAETHFARAVSALFPEFGTPPDGVELG